MRKILLAILAVCLSGCASGPPPMRYLFPLPPDQPKVEWLGTYFDESSLKPRSVFTTALLGDSVKKEFVAPSGMVADGEGAIFVGDVILQDVLKVDLAAGRISPLGLNKERMSVTPRQMAIDSRKQIYVVDSDGARVVLIDRAGKVLRVYGKGDLERPVGIAVDDAGRRLYVCDSKANQIFAYSFDGEKLFSFGKDLGVAGDLYGPSYLALGPDRLLYVADQLNARIVAFNLDGSFAKKFGQRSDSPGGFETIRGLAFDSDGNLWVADFRRSAMRVYNKEGQLLLLMSGPITHRMGFLSPNGVFITADDEVFISDYLGQRLTHWRYLSSKVLQRFPVGPEDLTRLPKAATP